MTRLPQPGADKGTWGDILNDFLSQVHNADGSIKSSALPSLASLGGITPTQVDTKIAAQAASDAGYYVAINDVANGATASGSALKAAYRRADVLNILDYGATDATAISAAITAAIAALPANGGEIVIPAGTYTANSTISISKSNVTIRGLAGSQVRPTSNPSGTLQSAGRVFDLVSVSNVTITGLTFLAPTSTASYTLSDNESATIHLNNTVNCTISDTIFTGSATQFGIFVTGLNAADNNILRNNLTSCGITYAYNGACRTICSQNTITNSPGNSLGGVGNGSSDSQDCIVSFNRIYNSARIGIEDWNTMRGTKILYNVIRTTGTNPTNVTNGAAFGISAVGRASVVQGNTITDVPSDCIETAGTGTRIIGNHCRQVAANLLNTGYGIFVDAGQVSGEMRGAVVRDNTIVDMQYGIKTWHDTGVVVIEGNTIQDALTTGISCDTDDSQSLLTVTGNFIRYTRALTAVVARTAIDTFSSTGAGAKAVVLSHNTIAYETTAGTGSLGYEIAIHPVTNNILIEGNVINGGGIAPNGQHPGISTQGATITGARILNNTLVGGATLDTTGMTSVVSTNNLSAA